jgi:hypothetical protein
MSVPAGEPISTVNDQLAGADGYGFIAVTMPRPGQPEVPGDP